MAVKIDNESKLAAQYDIALDSQGRPQLIPENVAKVQVMISYDSSYAKAANINAGPYQKGKTKYGGSSAFWINQLKIYLQNQPSHLDRELILEVVKSIDRDNSTHVNADKVGWEELTDRITKFTPGQLIDQLKEPAKNGYALLNILAEKTQRNPKDQRSNYSFATKFCHFLCLYLFAGEDEQDNFSIYDTVIGKAITKYVAIPKGQTLKNYEYFQSQVDAVLAGAGNAISRNGFDQLLWYYYKGKI